MIAHTAAIESVYGLVNRALVGANEEHLVVGDDDVPRRSLRRGICAGPAAYRPRRARDSPLYRLAETHYETFKQVYDERFASRYGAWRGVVERTLFAFLDCGIEEHGFARVRCDACRREFRVALSCKRRGFCPSCHSKRAVLWAESLSGVDGASTPLTRLAVRGCHAAGRTAALVPHPSVGERTYVLDRPPA